MESEREYRRSRGKREGKEREGKRVKDKGNESERESVCVFVCVYEGVRLKDWQILCKRARPVNEMCLGEVAALLQSWTLVW